MKRAWLRQFLEYWWGWHWNPTLSYTLVTRKEKTWIGRELELFVQCELSNLVLPTMGNSNIRSEGIFLLFSHCYSKGKEKNIGKKGKLGESGFILTLQTFFSWHLQTNQVIFSLRKSSKAFAAKSNQSIFLLALSQRFTQHYFRQKEKKLIKKSM